MVNISVAPPAALLVIHLGLTVTVTHRLPYQPSPRRYRLTLHDGRVHPIPERFHRGEHVWVVQPDGSQRPAEYVGEAEQSVWFGGPPRVIVAYPDTRTAESVDAARVVREPADG